MKNPKILNSSLNSEIMVRDSTVSFIKINYKYVLQIITYYVYERAYNYVIYLYKNCDFILTIRMNGQN